MNDVRDEWWLATLGRTVVWARLRVLDAGTAEVFYSDGNTLPYDSEDTARAALMDAEFVALGGLDEDDAADRGFDLAELVPPQVRSAGMSMAYNVAVMIFGGFAQFIVTWLIRSTGSPMAPAFYVMFGVTLGLFAAFFIKDRALERNLR